MEFVEGTDLAHLIEQREPLSLDSKVGLLIGLLNGLGYAHSKGVVHRDVKPANIRVTPDGRVKIMDFGIAHLQGSEITHSGAVLGTPDYMAPEQVRGLPVTAATDIFAAGAVLYELLTYVKPFTGETLHAVLFKVVTENPRGIREINPSLPENLQRIVDTALSKEPGQRYPTAEAMAADLGSAKTVLTDLETVATLRFNKPLNLGLPPLGWWRQKKTRYWAAGIAASLLVLGAGWAVYTGRFAVNTAPAATTAVASAPVPPPQPEPRTDSAPAPAPAPTPTKPPVTPRPRPTARAGTAVPKAVATSTPKPAVEEKLPTASDRLQLEQEVHRLERAISSTQTSEIKEVLPALQTEKGWEQFFRNKRDFRATLRIVSVDMQGRIASVKLSATYSFMDLKTGKQREMPAEYTAVLEKTSTGWDWKKF
jgi:serine/threonine-protein kinase